MKRLVVASVALLLMPPVVARAQNGAVAGTVVAEGRQRPLAGADVGVEGIAGKGVVTDASGKFSIPGVSGTVCLPIPDIEVQNNPYIVPSQIIDGVQGHVPIP